MQLENTPEAAGILYSAPTGQILLMKRAPGKVHGGEWSFPAGKLESGESPAAAAVREFMEETGVPIEGTLKLHNRQAGFTLFSHVGPVFSPVLNDEHTEFMWADPLALPEPLHPGVRESVVSQGLDFVDTKRTYDTNGWFEVKDNPISKVGVFPYRGASIRAPNPDKIYMVYRPEEELTDPATIESFKLLPWVDEHEMLGAEERGLTPAERKIVHGVTGEEIYFKNGKLYGNLKLFSDNLAKLIGAGKKELSAGYRCVYEFVSGIWNGQPYDAIQRKIRGNHLALVDQGRMGPDCSVLDHLTFTFDAKELNMADKEDKKTDVKDESEEMTLGEVCAMLKTLAPQVKSLTESMAAMGSGGGSAAGALDGDDKEKKDDKSEGKDEKEEKDKKGEGMDAALRTVAESVGSLRAELDGIKKGSMKAFMGHISQRDALASKLVPFIGTFDHAEKTLEEVAVYGAEKLGIKTAKGHEHVAVEAYLQDRTPPARRQGFGFDSANQNGGQGRAPRAVAAYLTAGRK